MAGWVALAAMTITQVVPSRAGHLEIFITLIVAALAVASVSFTAIGTGWPHALSAAAAAFALGLAAEWAGARTGFPFGAYRYTGLLRPAAGTVPLVGAQEIQFSDPPAGQGGQFRLDELAWPGHLGGRGGNLTGLHSHDPAILSAGGYGEGHHREIRPSWPGRLQAPRPARRAAAGSYGRITAAATPATPALPGTPADPCFGGIPSSRSPGIGRLKYPSDYQ